MSETVYAAGDCSICGQGLLLFCKSLANSRMLIMCDDCEAQWNDPTSAVDGTTPLSASEEYEQVKDATRDDIEEASWEKYIKSSLPRDSI